MKERPILLNAPMVRALLGGSKTQTRRVVAPQPICIRGGKPFTLEGLPSTSIPCPYGQPGDRLWVKEEHYLFGVWRVDGKRANGKPKYRFEVDDAMWAQFDEWPNGLITGGRSTEVAGWYKRIGMFMPRWASRILLEIVSVRVERLADINEADAIAEGVEPEKATTGGDNAKVHWRDYQAPVGSDWQWAESPRESFLSLWRLLEGPCIELTNPWVWVIEFKRVTA